jgi:hypothetical protein
MANLHASAEQKPSLVTGDGTPWKEAKVGMGAEERKGTVLLPMVKCVSDSLKGELLIAVIYLRNQ